MQDAPATTTWWPRSPPISTSGPAPPWPPVSARQRILVDPGIGFGKLLEHNLALLARLPEVALGRPLLLGASRKSFIAHLTGRGGGPTGSAAAWPPWPPPSGGATVVRVHDVAASVQFLDVLAAIDAARPAGQ